MRSSYSVILFRTCGETAGFLEFLNIDFDDAKRPFVTSYPGAVLWLALPSRRQFFSFRFSRVVSLRLA
ncbi:hypothetical protein E2C01_040705 [Portunus trituberculatus]|uniref:Uncharacterized protein n=1 Tax=Portunus trituberculatus TaxID=210409 RepID=A0A5B7FKI2_PORTR|nr:hypothetical protein [Portunus trituberculatus]